MMMIASLHFCFGFGVVFVLTFLFFIYLGSFARDAKHFPFQTFYLFIFVFIFEEEHSQGDGRSYHFKILLLLRL